MPRTGDTRDAAREPAREAEFRRFVLATAVSVLVTYAAAIALAVRTYQDTGNPAWVSAVFAAEFLPPVAIGVLLADRLNRLQPRRALVASDLASAAVFAVVAGVHTPIAVVALATVAGAAAGIFRPTTRAMPSPRARRPTGPAGQTSCSSSWKHSVRTPWRQSWTGGR